jgi:hypothetical protein
LDEGRQYLQLLLLSPLALIYFHPFWRQYRVSARRAELSVLLVLALVVLVVLVVVVLVVVVVMVLVVALSLVVALPQTECGRRWWCDGRCCTVLAMRGRRRRVTNCSGDHNRCRWR